MDFIPSALLPVCATFRPTCLGDCTGLSFIDSTSLDVCLNQRIASHKVFAGLAGRGKTSAGWFFGFKLHLMALMLLQQYPFSQRNGGVQDKYGLSWQLILSDPAGEELPVIVPSQGKLTAGAEIPSLLYYCDAINWGF